MSIKTKHVFLLWALTSLLFNLYAQSTKISANLSNYAGDTLTFHTNDGFLTNHERTLGKAVVLDNGTFELLIDLKETRPAHIHLGVYYGEIILEPGMVYEIMFPAKAEKSIQESLNPFFEEVPFYVGLEDTVRSELNNKVRELNQFLNDFLTVNQYRVAHRQISPKQIERFVTVSDSIFPDEGNNYFANYKFYKLAHVRNIAEVMSIEKAGKAFFANRPILYQNEPYRELLEQIFTGFYASYSKANPELPIMEWIQYDSNFKALRTGIAELSYIGNEALAELVIMIMLKQGYYADRFGAEAVITMLDELINTTLVKEHKLIANKLKQKIKHLLPGTFAPDFSLYDVDSTLVTLSEFRGKYVYLNFCNNSSYSCNKDYELLKGLKKKFSRHLEIVTVSTDKNFRAFTEQMYANKCSWIFLHYAFNPEVLKYYNIKAYPSYFLIDPYGKVLMAPAISPTENFENEFYRVLNKRT